MADINPSDTDEYRTDNHGKGSQTAFTAGVGEKSPDQDPASNGSTSTTELTENSGKDSSLWFHRSEQWPDPTCTVWDSWGWQHSVDECTGGASS